MTNNESKYITSKLAVPSDFEKVFSHFYFAENKLTESVTKTLLPSFQTILVFNFGSKALLFTKNNKEVEVDKCLVIGPIKQTIVYSLPPYSKILVANFKNDAFYRFFGNALIAEHLPINPDDLLPENCFTTLWTELNQIEDVKHQVNYILAFCKPYLREQNAIAKKFAIFNNEYQNPIKHIASEQKQTERNIQILHKKQFGYSAKEINRYLRFLKALELIQNTISTATKIDWFHIINECGYYDQSQLIHDFKHYINISPTKYLKFQQDICVAKPE